MKKIILLIGLLTALFALNYLIDFDVISTYFNEINASPSAPIIFIVAFILLSNIGVPITPLTLIAGSLFGVVYGIIYTIVASNISCCIAYFVAKLIGRDAVLKRIQNGSFVDTAIKKADKNAFIFIASMRMVPVLPCLIINYLSGVLNINLKSYMLGNLLGMLPGTIIYVYLGYTATSLIDNPILLVAVAVLLVIIMAITMIIKKKRALRHAE